MALDQSKTNLLKTQLNEFVKQYIVYDGSQRITSVYTAAVDTAHGGPCSKDEYEYDGGSTRVVKRKESAATWDSSWDI